MMNAGNASLLLQTSPMGKSVLVISKTSSPYKGLLVPQWLSSCFSRWGGGRALHLKRSIAGSSVTVLEKVVPKCSKIVLVGGNRNRVRLGHFKESKLLNRIF